MAGNDELLVDLLIARGLLTQEQADEARAKAEQGGEPILETIVSLGFLAEENVMMLLAAEYGMECFDLTNYKIPADAVAAIPPDIARRYKVVPVMKNGATLTVALSDPTDVETLDSLRFILKADVEGVIVSRKQIKEALAHCYGTVQESVESFLQDMTEGTVTVAETAAEDEEAGRLSEDDAPIIRLVSLIIFEAYRNRASDIHLEPLEKRFRVRYRIDGLLREVENPPKYLQNNIISRLKIMARMDISEHRVPQDGRIQISAMGKDLDLRVSCLPTTHGESIVMRILDKSSIQLGIPELGFFADDQQTIDKIINFPDGIFLVTGPTGSGKTTSLYAFLNTLNKPTRKIITAEDPVEYELSGVNQCQVNNEIGMTFANALRAMLRQAPNVIMVGEIRDMEAGEIAINAALTGHLVFSTLHTNDAPSAIPRLIDMGVKEFLVASALRAVMAQRLVRRICQKCAKPYQVTAAEAEALHLAPDYFKGMELKHGAGCPDCASRGYRGRMGIYELFILNEGILDLIYNRATSGAIREKARAAGMRTLREDGLRKAGAGLTTLEEVIRVTAADVAD
ncbi:MAG: ATPase, T2SS/T4P/T4SS family [Lentisphaeria bacterium]